MPRWIWERGDTKQSACCVISRYTKVLQSRNGHCFERSKRADDTCIVSEANLNFLSDEQDPATT